MGLDPVAALIQKYRCRCVHVLPTEGPGSCCGLIRKNPRLPGLLYWAESDSIQLGLATIIPASVGDSGTFTRQPAELTGILASQRAG